MGWDTDLALAHTQLPLFFGFGQVGYRWNDAGQVWVGVGYVRLCKTWFG
jgi:hypothetical protein